MTTPSNPFSLALIALTNRNARHFYSLKFASTLVAFSTLCLICFQLGADLRHHLNTPTEHQALLAGAAPSLLLPPAPTEKGAHHSQSQLAGSVSAPSEEPPKVTLKDLRKRILIAYNVKLPRNCTKQRALGILAELEQTTQA